MSIRPMRQSGTLQNITYYTEQHPAAASDYIWAEVIRNDYKRASRGGIVIRRSIPVFHFSIRRDPNIPVAEFTYEPKRKPATERLSPVTVTRLIRAQLAASDETGPG